MHFILFAPLLVELNLILQSRGYTSFHLLTKIMLVLSECELKNDPS